MLFAVTIQDLINIIFIAVGIGVCALCLLQITVSNHLRKEIKRYFQVFFVLIILYIGTHLIRMVLDGNPGEGIRTALYSVTFIELMSAGFMAFMMSVCVLTAAKADKDRELRLRLVLLVFLVVHVLIIVAGQFNSFIYYIDENNSYNRASLYLLSNVASL